MSYKDYITTVFVTVDDVLNLINNRQKTNKPRKEMKRHWGLLKGKTLIGDKAFNSKQLKGEFEEIGIQLEAIKKGKVHHKQKER